MLFLSLNVLAVVTIVVVTVRTMPDGRMIARRARRARHRHAPADTRPAPAVPVVPAEPVAPAVPAEPVAPVAPAVSVEIRHPEDVRRRPESLEGMLAALLLAGEITQVQYRFAAEEIAARDVTHHPLTVPDVGA